MDHKYQSLIGWQKRDIIFRVGLTQRWQLSISADTSNIPVEAVSQSLIQPSDICTAQCY